MLLQVYQCIQNGPEPSGDLCFFSSLLLTVLVSISSGIPNHTASIQVLFGFVFSNIAILTMIAFIISAMDCPPPFLPSNKQKIPFIWQSLGIDVAICGFHLMFHPLCSFDIFMPVFFHSTN